MIPTKLELEKLLAGELSPNAEQKLRESALSDSELSEEIASIDALKALEESIRSSGISASKDFTSEVMDALDSEEDTDLSDATHFTDRLLSHSLVDFLAQHCTPMRVSQGLIASAMCACVSLGFWMGRSQPQWYPMQVAEVLVPTQDIPPGTELTKSMFRRVARPLSEISDQSIRSLDDIGKNEVASTLILADYPLDRRYLSVPSSSGQRPIPQGFRAVAVGFETTANFNVKVGNEIEVVLALPSAEGSLQVTKVSSRATILAIQPKPPSSPGESSTSKYVATVLVPEIDAAKIDLGRSQGDILLMTTSAPSPARA